MSVIASQLLDINSWGEFFSQANSISEKDKGDLFEILTKQILITKPEYCSTLKNVWLQREVPSPTRKLLNLPSGDEGIDLIAETFDGKYWAIQCKFKGHNQPPTYKELSTFSQLANNYCKNISLALLVHTGERGVRKRKLLGEKYSEIGLEFWLGLTSGDWTRIHKSLRHKSIRPKPRVPRPHQQNAIDKAFNHFIDGKANRGRLLMPCGTGKSLTAFWIANALNAKSIIVAVPSLSLIKQSLEDWTREFVALQEDPIPEWLVICSDESTSKIDKDEFVSEAYSLGIPTTTNTNEISSFLSKKCKGRKIIFTTYQSSEKLAQAATDTHFLFDLAILDEAHKTVGIKTKAFATLLSDQKIHVSQRMFMTATERIFRGDNEDVLSMDDPKTYGDLFYQLSFKEAIHAEPPIICDYKILTICVTNAEIEQLISKNKLVTDEERSFEELESQSLAAAIALRKAVQKYEIGHAISFHKSIRGADAFSKLQSKLNNGNIDEINLHSKHISSKKSAGERARIMSDFIGEKPALMTNARCLTEGVDVPAIDCVLFADPKQSIIDIVQASGRALRPYAGKEAGYIMLPLIVPDDMSFEEFFDSTPFKEVARIITALSTQDETIAEEFRAISSGTRNGNRKVKVDGSLPVGLKLDLNDFADKINTKIWERVAKVNWMSFQEAKSFVNKLSLKNNDEWRVYCNSGSKPENIPTTPERIYAGKGWTNWGEWLGTGIIAARFKRFRSFEEAREYTRSLKLGSQNDWRDFCRSGNKPEDIPTLPHRTYKRNGWIGYGDWLGTGTIAPRLRTYLPFKEAREFVHQLSLNNFRDWDTYCQSGQKPDNIPSNPNITYKNKGWAGLGDWLGSGIIATRSRQYLPFLKAKKLVQSLNLKSQAEWSAYCRSDDKPIDIPSAPNIVYSSEGWSGWGDWLGTGRTSNQLRKYLSFEEARMFVHMLKLRNQNDWREYCLSGEKPANIPSNPLRVYLKQGWSGMGDWLGTGNVAPKLKKYRSFEDAKLFVQKLKLKNIVEWKVYCNSGNKPTNIPASPRGTYLSQGWSGWGDWLGTGTKANNKKQYRPFNEGRDYVHTLNLKSVNEWKEYCRSGSRPYDLPANPAKTYFGNGWISWGDWLGTEIIATHLINFRSFIEARMFVQHLNLKSSGEYKKYCRSGEKPFDIPTNPARTYLGKGWISWGDWLGK